MNFHTILEELNNLYEEKKASEFSFDFDSEADAEVDFEQDKYGIDAAGATADSTVDSTTDKDEFEDDAEIEIEDEERQLVLECENCGTLVVKSEDKVKIDEDTDLADVNVKCKSCKKSEGYKIIGVMTPYESDSDEDEEYDEYEDDEVLEIEDDEENKEDLDELLDINVPVNVQANNNEVAVGGATI